MNNKSIKEAEKLHSQFMAKLNDYEAHWDQKLHERNYIDAIHHVTVIHRPVAGYCNVCSVDNYGQMLQNWPCITMYGILNTMKTEDK